MNLIYLYEGEFKQGDEGHNLVKQAASNYSSEMDIDFDIEKAEIIREEKGKPYFVNIPIEFSLTHSEKLWMCMFSMKPCGLDLQIERNCEYEKIAGRFFTKEEKHYVKLWGLSGFFDVWVRKEAFVKLTGQGLFTDMPSVVDKDSNLRSYVLWNGEDYYFQSIEIADNIKCAICTSDEESVEMRLLG